MLRNYFVIALRNLRRHKIFSLIMVLGLAIGISASLVIYLIVHYQFSFDTFHADSNRIFRVVSAFRFSGEEYKNSGVPAPLYKAVRQEATGVEEAVGFFTYYGSVQMAAANKQEPVIFKNEGDIIFTDDAYFKLFPRQWLAGSAKGALEEPFKVVISESKAKKYFPGMPYRNIIGRQLTYNDSIRATVSGVIKNLSENTDFSFDQFISFATAASTGLKNNFGLESWNSTNSSSQLFVKLSAGTSAAQVHGLLKKLMKKYRTDDNKDAKNTAAWNLQPLSDLHFNGTYSTYSVPVASKTVLFALAAAALFLLLLGCINFINLTTAQSVQRAKEIGIRKTMGGTRWQLIFQFLIETFFTTLLAALLCVLLTPWILKIFTGFIPTGVHFDPFHQPQILLFLTVLIIVITLVAGFYPAYVLSDYKPVLVLKNQAYAHTGKTRSAWLRKTLTVSQFVIAQVFIMATVLVGKQIHYALTKEMGFKKEAIFSFNIPFNFELFQSRQTETTHAVLEEKLRSMPAIATLSVSGPPPSSDAISSGQLKYADGKKELETDVQFKYGDTAYLGLYGLHLLAGRNLRQSDSTIEYIINETYAKLLGFINPQDAIGKNLKSDNQSFPIIGVIADFHQRSIHEPIKPLAISCAVTNSYTFHVALKPQSPGSDAWKNTIAKIEKEYKALYPKEDFEYQFFDESIAQFYKSDQDTSKLLSWATALSVLISCLGLLGLVIYTTNQRTKEIGIRKVLGATVVQIVTILSKDFLLLVLVAFVIAVPVAWWSMQQWLQNFAFRTPVSWWVFGASGACMLLLTLLVLSVRTIKAASANPVKNLRSE